MELRGVTQINAAIVARDGPPVEKEDPRRTKFKEMIHAQFDGIVLCKECFPDPPVRGRYGYAYIPLKEGAVPQRQKPFRMHGERYDAHVKVTEDWLEHKFLEPPTAKKCEWRTQTFVVPKKAEFPWRGVADMRGPNSQTRRCNYPLPKIEDVLVKQGRNKIFSIIDLCKAFHQQPLDPDSRHITSCYTPLGVFQWRVNVMG